MKSLVIVDSAVDLPKKYSNKYNIKQIPQKVIFENGEEFKLGEDISVQEYYKKLHSSETIPTSSAPNVNDFFEVFKQTFEEGYEHILFISVAHALSSTLNNARIASKRFPGKVTIFDTESASGVQGLLALEAVHLLKKEFDISSIVEILDELKQKTFLCVGFQNLESVYKSGRLKSKFTLYITKLFGVKPVVVMKKPGILKSTLPGFFSSKRMEKKLVKLSKKHIDRHKKYNVIISHVNNTAGTERIAYMIKKNAKFSINNIFITECSPIIGTYTGPGTIVLSLAPTYVEFED